LNSGACVLSEQVGGNDAGCKKWDWDNQKCLECSARWYFNANGVCTPVNDYCSAWDNYGVCTACYKGYDLKDGACVLADSGAQTGPAGPTDLGCKKWDWNNQKCLECSTRWYFGYDGICKKVDDNCASWEQYGACTACYPGYVVNDGACVVSNLACKQSNA